MSGFDITFDNDFCEAADSVYVLSEPHAFGGNKHLFPTVNNRGFIFKVVKKGDTHEHLLMVGIPGLACIPKAKKVEEASGLKLELIVGSGDFHHMAMADWLKEFPDVKIVHSALKFPTTRNGKKILENEEWKARLELVEGPDFPSLEPYSDTLKFFGFNQCLTPPDAPFTPPDIHTPTKLTLFQYLKNVSKLEATERMLCVWAYHVPTKQLVYEHNMDFFLSKAKVSEFPFPLKYVFPKEKLQSAVKQPTSKGPKTLEGCKGHCEVWANVLDLDVRALLDYHSDPGLMPGRWETKEAYRKEMVQILKATGEDVEDGSAMMKKLHGHGPCCIL
ncbi:expressed unknown protein [Seminavis robusta]|uniref:Uncharacterized protein n=1 Tax=Seminavis robusta TaxID=568900 RepID=A0A9N8EG75_9STRA|nr:expressed unknown protein [Seminavis robusta]|eukprot:Sro898_g217640.1 n/a (332) ;mRNA; r:28917-30112